MDSQNVDIVVIRMDRLGDLVLSLPADEHPAFAGQRVQWFITKGLSFVAEQAAPKRRAIEFLRAFSPLEFSRMVTWLKTHKPTTAVVLHAPWWVNMALFIAGVQHRIGRLSQWHSYLFLNVGVRQKRSKSTQHESDYNFDLIEFGFNRLGVRRYEKMDELKKTYLKLIAPNPQSSIASRGLEEKKYRVVHPGMGGSALNWPMSSYRSLIERLALEHPVVITGTKSDLKILKPLMDIKGTPNIKWLVDQLKPYELLDMLAMAKSVVAPSTGVLHLAASLGTPTIGIYSPRRVEHPTRWGPRGPNIGVVCPKVAVQELFRPSVMEQIHVDEVVDLVRQLESKKT